MQTKIKCKIEKLITKSPQKNKKIIKINNLIKLKLMAHFLFDAIAGYGLTQTIHNKLYRSEDDDEEIQNYYDRSGFNGCIYNESR